MKATILRDGQLVVEHLPDLTPGPGQVLVEPLACGICGSDLHMVHHGQEMVDAATAAGVGGFAANLDPTRDVVMGHEISCRVLEVGTGVEGVRVGSEYAAMPFLESAEGRIILGYHNELPGGFGDQMLVTPNSLVPITNGLDPRIAALTEPMAVGLQAVNESAIRRGRVALVAGAGPVGLAVVAALASKGVETIVASDFSPARRTLAIAMGATRVIDPARESLFDGWREASDGITPPVIYDAVGVPGMIDSLMVDAPERSQILIVGLCMPPDTIRPFVGVYKRLNLQFVMGWTPEEFTLSLHNLAEGVIDGSAMITGEVGLDEVQQAFADLSDPDAHVKVLVRPNL